MPTLKSKGQCRAVALAASTAPNVAPPRAASAGAMVRGGGGAEGANSLSGAVNGVAAKVRVLEGRLAAALGRLDAVERLLAQRGAGESLRDAVAVVEALPVCSVECATTVKDEDGPGWQQFATPATAAPSSPCDVFEVVSDGGEDEDVEGAAGLDSIVQIVPWEAGVPPPPIGAEQVAEFCVAQSCLKVMENDDDSELGETPEQPMQALLSVLVCMGIEDTLVLSVQKLAARVQVVMAQEVDDRELDWEECEPRRKFRQELWHLWWHMDQQTYEAVDEAFDQLCFANLAMDAESEVLMHAARAAATAG